MWIRKIQPRSLICSGLFITLRETINIINILFLHLWYINSHINKYIMSFILRKLFKEHNKNSYSEHNEIIGAEYCTVTEHNEGWETLKKYWDEVGENIYCFIIHDGGSKVIPLYRDQGNYIMTSDGKTFANVTFKN